MNKFSLLRRNRIRRRLNLLFLALAYIPAFALYHHAKTISDNPFAHPIIEEQTRYSRSTSDTLNSRKSPIWISEE
jgi:hypothetical protein